MDTLDSRKLGAFDCFGQRFMRAGSYSYRLSRAGFTGLSDQFPFVVHVSEADDGHRMAQHTVFVREEGRRLVAEPGELKIQRGDLVLWHGKGVQYAFAVEGEKAFFSSTAMRAEAGFSHAFTSPGEYRWVDSHGSGLSGRVLVKPFDAETEESRRRWFESAKKGTVVTINGNIAQPAEVSVHAGQTVFFAIVKTEGISITDDRVLKGDRSQKSATS